MLKKALLWIVALALTTQAGAQSEEALWHATKGECQPHAKLVLYINGMLRPHREKVLLDAVELQRLLDVSGIYGDQVQLLYNPSSGDVVEDLAIEATTQKLGETARNTVEFSVAFQLLKLQMMGLEAIGVGAEAEKIEQLRARVSTAAYDQLQTAAGLKLLDDFGRDIQTSLDASNKVVLVAHSQGNFVANALYTRMVAANPDWVVKGLSVVNLANPSGSAPSGLYLTSSADAAMRFVPGRMPINLEVNPIVSALRDPLGHGFVDIYLSASPGLLPIGTVLDHTLQLISEALDQGAADVPRCCNGATPGTLMTRTDLNFLLRASDNPSLATTGSKPMNAFVMGQLANEPWWAVTGMGVNDADRIDLNWRIPESLEFKPRVYSATSTPSYVMFAEPSEMNGEVFRHLGDGSSVRVDVKTSRFVCIDYNYASTGVMNLDRTDASSAAVWLEIAGSATWSLASRSRLDCSVVGPAVCNPSTLPNYDNFDIGFDFGPIRTSVRVTPATVRF